MRGSIYRHWRLGAWTLAWLATLPAAGATHRVRAAETPMGAPVVTLHVYDVTGLPTATAAGLQAAVTTALAPADITIRWLWCRSADSRWAASCSDPVGRDIVVRVAETHEGLSAKRCGFALPTTTGGVGFISLSTACAARTAQALESARYSGQPPLATEGEILGYTLAHELAHVLLPGAAHSREGLFRGQLERRHWKRVRSGRLGFAGRDLDRLREAAAGRQ